MKFYATITSDRASKSQGGNDYIHLDLRNEDGEVVLKLMYTDSGVSVMHTKSVYFEAEQVEHLMQKPLKSLYQTKGEKQKTAKYCTTCGNVEAQHQESCEVCGKRMTSTI